MDVAAYDIDDITEFRSRFLPNVERFGGSDRSGVSSSGEGSSGGRNEGSEFRSGAVSVENGLVTDGDELDKVPLAPADDG